MIETRITTLETRLRAVEDELEIQRLLNRYGPLVDSGAGVDAAALWTNGGTYAFEGDGDSTQLEAPADLEALYQGDFHRALITAGCSHLTVAPVIRIAGDSAQAVGYSFLIVSDGNEWRIQRAAVNHWTLARAGRGWRVEHRLNRLLNGSDASHDMLSTARA